MAYPKPCAMLWSRAQTLTNQRQMSSAVSSTWSSEASQNGPNWSAHALANGQSPSVQLQQPANYVASTSATGYGWQPPAHWKVDPQQPTVGESPQPALPAYVRRPQKSKNRTPEEEEIIKETAAKYVGPPGSV